MKKMILLAVCMLTGMMTLSAQKTIYVINNEVVDNFDGSQLKGKTVQDYKITTSGTGRDAITVHSITTTRTASSFTFSMPPLDSLRMPFMEGFGHFSADSILLHHSNIRIVHPGQKNIVYVIDGERNDDPNAFSTISPEDIESVSVLKNGSPEQLKYGENVSVIQIQTKKGKKDLIEKLRTLPGVKVDADGNVTVAGEPVNKITINGRTYKLDRK